MAKLKRKDSGKEDPMASSKDRQPTRDEPLNWDHIEQETQKLRTRVAEWLEQPERRRASKVVEDIQQLAQNTLIRDGYTFFYPSWRDDHQKEFEENVSKTANDLQRVLGDLITEDPNAVRETLRETLRVWQNSQREGTWKVQVRSIEQWAANALAAVLVFQHLPLPKNEEAQQKRDKSGEGDVKQEAPLDSGNPLWWPVLLKRTAHNVILPRDKRQDEEAVQDCIVVLLESSASDQYTYQGLRPAIRYFQNAWRNASKPSSPREPPEEESEETRKQKRTRIWHWAVIRLGREKATVWWVLFVLKEDRLRQWLEITHCVSLKYCGILTKEDLPNTVTWKEVHAALSTVAKNAQALRQRYCNDNRRLAAKHE